MRLSNGLLIPRVSRPHGASSVIIAVFAELLDGMELIEGARINIIPYAVSDPAINNILLAFTLYEGVSIVTDGTIYKNIRFIDGGYVVTEIQYSADEVEWVKNQLSLYFGIHNIGSH